MCGAQCAAHLQELTAYFVIGMVALLSEGVWAFSALTAAQTLRPVQHKHAMSAHAVVVGLLALLLSVVCACRMQLLAVPTVLSRVVFQELITVSTVSAILHSARAGFLAQSTAMRKLPAAASSATGGTVCCVLSSMASVKACSAVLHSAVCRCTMGCCIWAFTGSCSAALTFAYYQHCY